jgi:hypothetical protein
MALTIASDLTRWALEGSSVPSDPQRVILLISSIESLSYALWTCRHKARAQVFLGCVDRTTRTPFRLIDAADGYTHVIWFDVPCDKYVHRGGQGATRRPVEGDRQRQVGGERAHAQSSALDSVFSSEDENVDVDGAMENENGWDDEELRDSRSFVIPLDVRPNFRGEEGHSWRDVLVSTLVGTSAEGLRVASGRLASVPPASRLQRTSQTDAMLDVNVSTGSSTEHVQQLPSTNPSNVALRTDHFQLLHYLLAAPGLRATLSQISVACKSKFLPLSDVVRDLCSQGLVSTSGAAASNSVVQVAEDAARAAIAAQQRKSHVTATKPNNRKEKDKRSSAAFASDPSFVRMLSSTKQLNVLRHEFRDRHQHDVDTNSENDESDTALTSSHQAKRRRISDDDVEPRPDTSIVENPDLM